MADNGWIVDGVHLLRLASRETIVIVERRPRWGLDHKRLVCDVVTWSRRIDPAGDPLAPLDPFHVPCRVPHGKMPVGKPLHRVARYRVVNCRKPSVRTCGTPCCASLVRSKN